MPLQSFISKNLPAISAAWLNAVDVIKFTIFADATTKAAARVALTSDAPLEVTNGGTGNRGQIADNSNFLLWLASFFPFIYQFINPRTPAEIAALVTPVNYAYREGIAPRYGMVGDDATNNDTAIAALRAVAAQNVKCKIPKGIYRYTTSPNWAVNGLQLVGERGAILKHMGTGVAFNADAGAAAFVYGLIFEQLIVQGSTNSTDGFSLAGIAYSTLRNLEVRSVDTAAFRIKGNVANLFDTCQVNRSIAGGAFSPVPNFGFYLDNNTAGTFTADCTFINCDAENFDGGTTGVGANFADASGNTWRGGSFETLATGLQLSATSRHNHFDTVWMEHNATNDVVDQGTANQFTNCHMASASSGNNCEAQGNDLLMVGGYCRVVNLNAGTLNSTFVGVAFDNSGGNGIIGSGTFKNYGCCLVNGSFAVTSSIEDVLGSRGTWTPSIGGSATYTTQQGFYTVTNRTVNFWGRLTINALGTGSTNVISGLPLTSNATYRGTGVVSFFASIATALTSLTMDVAPSGTVISLRTLTAAATSTGTAAVFANGADIIFGGSYLLP